MKFALLFALILFAGIASAETIKSGNYSVSFDLSKPHEVAAEYGVLIIKTFDGRIAFEEFSEFPKNILLGDWIGRTDTGKIYKNKQDVYEYVPYNETYLLTSTTNLSDWMDFLKNVKVKRLA